MVNPPSHGESCRASAAGIRASVPYLRALPDVVRRLLSAPIDFDGLVTLEAPRELPAVVHSQWWHPRFDSDPAHQWLRQHVREAIG